MRRAVLALTALAAAALAPTAAMSQGASEAVQESPAKAVQRHFDAYRSWDLDQFVATFDANAIVIVDNLTATGHDEIRAFYASNFAGERHTIRVVDSGMSEGLVYVKVAYTFSDGREGCCSFGQYAVENGKITFLSVTWEGDASKRP